MCDESVLVVVSRVALAAQKERNHYILSLINDLRVVDPEVASALYVQTVDSMEWLEEASHNGLHDSNSASPTCPDDDRNW